jgi:hypothetical protein
LSPSGHEIAGKRNQGQGDACGFVAVTFPGHDLDIRHDNSPCDIHRLWFPRGLEADALRRPLPHLVSRSTERYSNVLNRRRHMHGLDLTAQRKRPHLWGRGRAFAKQAGGWGAECLLRARNRDRPRACKSRHEPVTPTNSRWCSWRKARESNLRRLSAITGVQARKARHINFQIHLTAAVGFEPCVLGAPTLSVEVGAKRFQMSSVRGLCVHKRLLRILCRLFLLNRGARCLSRVVGCV